MARNALAVLLALAVAIGVAGCGGGSGGDAARIRRTLDAFAAARDRGDAKEACEHLVAIAPEGELRGGPVITSSEQDEGKAANDKEQSPDACERAFTQAVSASRRGLRSYHQDVGAIAVDGDRASAQVRVSLQRADGSHLDREVTYRLARSEGGWRILLYPE